MGIDTAATLLSPTFNLVQSMTLIITRGILKKDHVFVLKGIDFSDS